MPFSSEEVGVAVSDRLDRSTYTQTRRMRSSGKEDNEEAEERGPHLGSDSSSPTEATPQIPPSCWTSCSLHNRIRMNRPSPVLPVFSFSSASSFSVPISLFIFFSRFSGSYSLFLPLLRFPPPFADALLAPVLFLFLPSSALADFPSLRYPPRRHLSRDVPLAQRIRLSILPA